MLSTFITTGAFAHCDTTQGPIIPEAKAALEKGDVTPVLKWVKKDSEAEIKSAFEKAVAVRSKGEEAKELADQYFLETLIRIHRAGEGAPYTGLKDEPVPPIVAMSDAAVAEGSVDKMAEKIANHAASAIKEKFAKVAAAKSKMEKEGTVDAGREYVEAYVVYTHYVEGLHDSIMSSGAHEGHAVAEEGETGDGGHAH